MIHGGLLADREPNPVSPADAENLASTVAMVGEAVGVGDAVVGVGDAVVGVGDVAVGASASDGHTGDLAGA